MERTSLHPHVPEMETLYLHVGSEAACDAEYMYYSPPVEYITSSSSTEQKWQELPNPKHREDSTFQPTFCRGNTLTLSSAPKETILVKFWCSRVSAGFGGRVEHSNILMLAVLSNKTNMRSTTVCCIWMSLVLLVLKVMYNNNYIRGISYINWYIPTQYTLQFLESPRWCVHPKKPFFHTQKTKKQTMKGHWNRGTRWKCWEAL